jgi:enterochelin esterase-like enzyme
MTIPKHENKKIYCLIFLISFFSFTSVLYAQVYVKRQLSAQSEILNQQVRYSVILPNSYYLNTTRYPVIYLLHGFGGDHTSWLDRCNVNLLIDSLVNKNLAEEYIYILPDAYKTYYINNYDSSFRYEDFFIRELIPFVDSAYRTKSCREARNLIGLSMGGYGAVILAVKHPELFGSVVAMSSALRNAEEIKNMPQKNYEIFFSNVYGTQLINEERITNHWKKNSPYCLIDSSSSLSLKDINWYIDCGMQDPLINSNESFHNLMMMYSIPHEFQMRPGRHNWVFWHQSFMQGLSFLKRTYKENCTIK